MTTSTNREALGPEIATLQCRTRYATGCDMGHPAIAYYVAPFICGLVFTAALAAVHNGEDVLNKLGLLKYTSETSIYLCMFFLTTIAHYWFWFSAPNCPITIHENGIRYKSRMPPFSEILGVRFGSGEIQDPRFRLTVSPIGRLSQAMQNVELARQNVVNCSFYIVTSDYKELMVTKGLILYEKEDLMNLFAVINEDRAAPGGAAPSELVGSYT